MSLSLPSLRGFVAAACLGAGLVACSSPSPAGPDPEHPDAGPVDSGPIEDPPLPTSVCQREHTGTTADGDKVTVCDELFPTEPRLRLPADDAKEAGESSLHVVFDGSSGLQAIARGGRYSVVDDAGTGIWDATGAAKLPPKLYPFTNRQNFLVYRVRGTITSPKSPTNETEKSLHIAQGIPVVYVPAATVLNAYADAWEGTVSPRALNPASSLAKFDREHQVPVRLEIANREPLGHMRVWENDKERLADGVHIGLQFRVANRTTSVRGADGACLPALSDLGDRTPFRNLAGDIELHSEDGMHAPGDYMLTGEIRADDVGSIMGGEPLSIAELLVRKEPARLMISNHGTPSGFEFTVHPVRGGGGNCP